MSKEASGRMRSSNRCLPGPPIRLEMGFMVCVRPKNGVDPHYGAERTEEWKMPPAVKGQPSSIRAIRPNQ